MLYPSPARREPQHFDVPSLLTSCHARIRHFSAMAVTLAETTDAPEHEIAEAARQLYRYFAHALPLHAEDEDESVLPRLAGRTAELDSRLERMRAEHGRIDELLAPQLEAWQVLAERPAELATLAPRLSPTGRELRSFLGEHLESEEKYIFVALQKELSHSRLGAIEQEIRERRRRAYRW